MKYVYRNKDGIKRTFYVDPDKPYSPLVHTEQDVAEILDSVNRDREIMKNNGPSKVVARVPVTVWEESVHQQWDDRKWAKYLNSSEARPFRIWEGEV
jgi:hypothetical protein